MSWAQEWRLFLKAPANLALLGVLLALSLLGAWNGVRKVETARAGVAEAVLADGKAYAAKRARLIELEAGRAAAAQFGDPRKAHQAVLNLSSNRPLVPPPAELPAFSASETKPTPDVLAVGIQTRHKDQQPSLQDPSNRLDGAFDLAFAATWLLPLFALVLTYDVLSRDREQAVASLLAVQGADLRRIVATRLAVRFLALFVTVGVVAAGACLWTEHGRLAMALPALLGWLLALALFLLFWMGLAAGVNARARTAAGAALILLGAWIAASLVAPAVISAVAQAAAPPPDRFQAILDLRALETELTQKATEVREAYYAERPENRPRRVGDEFETYFVTEMYPRTLAFDRAYAPKARRMEAARIAQGQVMRDLSLVSPSLALRLLTDDLAGGAPERRAAFLEAADRFQARWRAHFDRKLATMTPLTREDYDTMPAFVPAPEPARRQAGRRLRLVLALALPALAAVAWGWRALDRAKPI